MRARLLRRYRIARGETPVTRVIKTVAYVLVIVLTLGIIGTAVWMAWGTGLLSFRGN
jgi:hypothetical protein